MPAAQAECCVRHVRNDVLLVYKPAAIFYIGYKNWLVGIAVGIKRHWCTRWVSFNGTASMLPQGFEFVLLQTFKLIP